MEGMSEETTGGVSDWCSAAGEGPFFFPAVALEDINNQKGMLAELLVLLKHYENTCVTCLTAGTSMTAIKVNINVFLPKKRTFKYSQSETLVFTKDTPKTCNRTSTPDTGFTCSSVHTVSTTLLSRILICLSPK